MIGTTISGWVARQWTGRPATVVSVIVCGMLIAASVRIGQLTKAPGLNWLGRSSDARSTGTDWVRADESFELYAKSPGAREVLFRSEWTLDERVVGPRLIVRAFRGCSVWLDTDPSKSEPLYTSSPESVRWRDPHEISLGDVLETGRHRLSIRVTNRGAPPCLLAYVPATGSSRPFNWDTLMPNGEWRPAISIRAQPMPSLWDDYPTVWISFLGVGPSIVLLFVAAWRFWLWNIRSVESNQARLRWSMSPRSVTNLLLAAWTLLAINNLRKLPPHFGFDLPDHLGYIRFIVEHHRLPLATDDWQMFQAPLFYVLMTPFSLFLHSPLSEIEGSGVLRIVPLLCGLAQIELTYRATREVFPENCSQQNLATLVGGLMPMNLYMSHAVGNEPLAGCLSSLAIVMCLKLLARPQEDRPARFFVALGVAWGASILTKVTALLLTPLVVAVIALHTWQRGRSVRRGMLSVGLAGGTCAVVSGWYFARNYWYLGRLFVGGWDQSRGIDWSQDPGYRTWNQFCSFGRSLWQPVYSGVWSFWDSLFSSMWADGWLLGTVVRPQSFPWNLDLMQVGVWLAIVPMGCLVAGALPGWKQDASPSRRCAGFALAAVVIYLSAIGELYLRVPIYSQAKATYMLGILPCFAILAARGAEPILRRRRLRAAFSAWLTCWAAVAYLAFFVW